MRAHNIESELHFGTCGWSWDAWEEVFYPGGLPAQERLAHYARFLKSVEADSTFYHVPPAHVFDHWNSATPENFRFACKLPRAITHEKRLRDCDAEMAEFEGCIERLGPKLGCVLVQLPPSLHPDDAERDFRSFVSALPAEVRWAVEFRGRHWHSPRFIHLLEEHNIAWVWHDLTEPGASDLAAFDLQPVTSDHLYIRLLGPRQQAGAPETSGVGGVTQPGPRDHALDAWVTRISRQAAERAGSVYIFADNHYEGFAPATCGRIARRFGMEISLPAQDDLKHSDRDQMQLPLPKP